MTKDVQAKNIPDMEALDRVERGHHASLLAAYPPKVVAAKLRALTKRGLVTSGPPFAYVLTPAGRELLG